MAELNKLTMNSSDLLAKGIPAPPKPPIKPVGPPDTKMPNDVTPIQPATSSQSNNVHVMQPLTMSAPAGIFQSFYGQPVMLQSVNNLSGARPNGNKPPTASILPNVVQPVNQQSQTLRVPSASTYVVSSAAPSPSPTVHTHFTFPQHSTSQTSGSQLLTAAQPTSQPTAAHVIPQQQQQQVTSRGIATPTGIMTLTTIPTSVRPQTVTQITHQLGQQTKTGQVLPAGSTVVLPDSAASNVINTSEPHQTVINLQAVGTSGTPPTATVPGQQQQFFIAQGQQQISGMPLYIRGPQPQSFQPQQTFVQVQGSDIPAGVQLQTIRPLVPGGTTVRMATPMGKALPQILPATGTRSKPRPIAPVQATGVNAVRVDPNRHNQPSPSCVRTPDNASSDASDCSAQFKAGNGKEKRKPKSNNKSPTVKVEDVAPVKPVPVAVVKSEACETVEKSDSEDNDKPDHFALKHVVDGFIIYESDSPFPIEKGEFVTPEETKNENEKDKKQKNKKRKRNKSSSKETKPVNTTDSVPTELIKTEVKTEASTLPDTPINQWTVEQVASFVAETPGCSGYADAFRTHEIDGSALVLLKADVLMAALSMKLGPAVKVCARVKELTGQADSPSDT